MRDKNVLIRVSEEEKARWKKAAGAKSVSEWVRDLVEKELAPAPAIWVRENVATSHGTAVFKFKPDPKPTTQKKSRCR